MRDRNENLAGVQPAPPRGSNRPYPTNAWLSLTNVCNLRCAHCSIRYDENQHAEHVELSDKAFDVFVRDVLPHLKTLKLGGNGLGEQLCAKKWRERLEPILASGVRLTLQTNGLLLSEDAIDALVSADCEFDISIEGADGPSYARIRGPHFEKLVTTVSAVAEARARLHSSSRLLFSYTLFRDNAEQLQSVVALAADLGVDSVAAMHLIPVWEEQRYQSLVYHRAYSNDMIERARVAAEERAVELIAPKPFGAGSMSAQAETGGHPRERKPCPHPAVSVSVNERGEVLPCCNSYMVMGNLNEDAFDAVWNGRRYGRLRANVNGERPPANCRTCVLRDPSGTDEPLLLAAIGPNPEFAQSTVAIRRLQRTLRGTPVGAKLLPWMKSAYRRRAS